MPRSNYSGTKKTASDAAFYSGFATGFLASVEGFFLFLTRKELRKLLSASLKPLRNAQLAYIVVCILIFLVAREPTDSFSKLFWTFWRWGRMVTVLISLVLDRQRGVNAAMFFAALYIRDDQFGSALEAKKPAKRSTLARIRKFKRFAKIAAIRGLAALVKFVIPSTNIVLGPALKFASIRPVLGDKVAAAVAAIHLLPSSFLESTILDDVLASVAEAIVDAETRVAIPQASFTNVLIPTRSKSISVSGIADISPGPASATVCSCKFRSLASP